MMIHNMDVLGLVVPGNRVLIAFLKPFVWHGDLLLQQTGTI